MTGIERRADDGVSADVVEAVAAHLDVDPLELDPRLADVTDPDALDALFAPRPDGSTPPVSVAFEFHGLWVSVDATDGVDVRSLKS